MFQITYDITFNWNVSCAKSDVKRMKIKKWEKTLLYWQTFQNIGQAPLR